MCVFTGEQDSLFVFTGYSFRMVITSTVQQMLHGVEKKEEKIINK